MRRLLSIPNDYIKRKFTTKRAFFPKERIFPGLLVINYARLFSRVVVISKYEMRFRIRLNVNKKGKEEEESVCVCVWNESIREVVRVSPYFPINECALSRTKL